MYQPRILTHVFCGLVVCLPCLSGCLTGPAARTGTALGGLGGALIGAAAGAPRGNSLGGAAIGALAGSAMGGAIGNAADEDQRRFEAGQVAFEQQRLANAISLDQVVQMTRSGLGEQVISNQIRTQGVTAPLSTSDLVMLKQNGVSDLVISAWQERAAQPVVVAPAAPPVIIQEHWVEPACYHEPVWCGPRFHYHHHRPRAGIHVRF